MHGKKSKRHVQFFLLSPSEGGSSLRQTACFFCPLLISLSTLAAACKSRLPFRKNSSLPGQSGRKPCPAGGKKFLYLFFLLPYNTGSWY